MKCKNCGINYDDSEKECPMCGTRAGHGTRAAAPHYTGYGHTVHDETSCTHETFSTKQSFSRRVRPVTQPRQTVLNGQSAKKKPARGASIAVIIVVVLLSVLLPIVQSFAEHWEELRAYLETGDSYSDFTDLPAPDTYDYDNGMIFEPMLQGDWIVDRADGGTLKISIDGDGYYALECATDNYHYYETGVMYLWYNSEDEEGYWSETYTPAAYDSYTLNLDRREMRSEGMPPRALASGVERDVYLVLYENKEQADGSRYIVWDYTGRGEPLITEEFTEMHKVQGG